VELMSHKVAVMYLGKIVEIGLSERIRPGQASLHAHPWSSLVEKQSRRPARRRRMHEESGVFDFERPLAGAVRTRCRSMNPGRPASALICSRTQLTRIAGAIACVPFPSSGFPGVREGDTFSLNNLTESSHADIME